MKNLSHLAVMTIKFNTRNSKQDKIIVIGSSLMAIPNPVSTSYCTDKSVNINAGPQGVNGQEYAVHLGHGAFHQMYHLTGSEFDHRKQRETP